MKPLHLAVAVALALSDCVVVARAASTSANGTDGIDVAITLAPWTPGPPDCGTSSELGVHPGDGISVCYTVTNHSGHELDWHYLHDSVFGDSFLLGEILNEPLADGASMTRAEPIQTVWASATITGTWTAQDAPPPAFVYDDSAPFAFIDLTSSPTATVLLQPGADGQTGGISADVTMPFTFPFYENGAASLLCVGFRGVVFVDQPHCDPSPTDSNFEQMPVYFDYKFIAPAWTIWGATLDGGTVYSDTQGTAPNRQVVVEWAGMIRNGMPGPGITFEMVIDEATGAITFQYLSMAFNDGGDDTGDFGAESSVGIQRDFGGGSAPIYTQYSFWEPVLTDGKAIRWTPGTPRPYSASATASANVEILAAAIALDPGAIHATATAGGSTGASFTISNPGTDDLAWTIGEAPAGGFHFARAYEPRGARATTPARIPAGVDPRDAIRSRSAASPAPALPLGTSVPAYGIAYDSGASYVSFDAADPGTTSFVNHGVSIEPVEVGGFVDNDFSKEYLLGNGGCDDDGCYGFYLETLTTDPNSETGSNRTISSGAVAAPTIAGELWHGLKWDATTHTLYAVASTAGPPSRTDLYTIDPEAGAITWIAELDAAGVNGTKLLDIAIGPDGSMYGIDEWTDTLFAIDKATGHIASIGATGLDAGNYDLQSMDFDQSTGTLYYAAFPLTPTVSAIYTVDLATGQATEVGPFGDGTMAVRAFAIAVAGGPCANTSDVPWLTVDHGGGTTSPGGSDTIDVTLDATTLDAGTYDALVCVASNALFHSAVALPVTFTVGGSDPIFADGFDE